MLTFQVAFLCIAILRLFYLDVITVATAILQKFQQKVLIFAAMMENGLQRKRKSYKEIKIALYCVYCSFFAA